MPTSAQYTRSGCVKRTSVSLRGFGRPPPAPLPLAPCCVLSDAGLADPARDAADFAPLARALAAAADVLAMVVAFSAALLDGLRGLPAASPSLVLGNSMVTSLAGLSS